MVRITFDSNVWQRLAVPERFPNDPDPEAVATVREALKQRKLAGYVVETVATLEAIRKIDRADYLAANRSTITFIDTPAPPGCIGGRVAIGPADELHPGLMPVLSDRLNIAISELGFRLLHAPRIGIPRPPELLDPAIFADESVALWDRHERFGEILDAIETRGVGFARAKAISRRIEDRTGLSPRPWFEWLRHGNADELAAVPKAVAEWADGDAVASHFSYGCDIFCTGDEGKDAGKSVLSPEHRRWLEAEYGLGFMSLPVLADHLG